MIAARTAAVLSWASAVSAVCRQMRLYVLAWDWSRPGTSFPEREIFFSRPLLIPVKKKSSLAFRVHPGRY